MREKDKYFREKTLYREKKKNKEEEYIKSSNYLLYAGFWRGIQNDGIQKVIGEINSHIIVSI